MNEQEKVFIGVKDINQITKASGKTIIKYLKVFAIPFMENGKKKIYKYEDCKEMIQYLLDMKKTMN